MKMIVMLSRQSSFAVLAILALATLAGCGSAGGTASGTTSDGRLDVVASFYPLQYVAEQVGGDRVHVTTLTAPGVEPHDLELTPKQVGRLTKAALVVYEKGLQPAVDEAVEQNAADAGFDVSGAARLEATGAHFQDEGERAHDDDIDPHFWLDPTRLADVGDAVAGRLAAADPDRADGYRQRAAALRAQLTRLDGEFRSGLATCRLKTFVTTHEAFAYLAQRYGLDMVGIAGLTPDAEPSPARIKQVEDVVRANRVTTIFYEELVSPKVAESVARDLEVRAAVLSPIEGLADEHSTENYLSLMRENLAELEKANDCS
jgi:zinc transport system substrate-binding protein